MRKNPHHLERRVIIPLFMLIAFLTRIGADLSLSVTALPEEAGFLRRTETQNWADAEGGGGRERHRPIAKRDNNPSPRRRATPGAAEEEEEDSIRSSPSSKTRSSSSAAEAAATMRRATGARKRVAEARSVVTAAAVGFGRADSVVRRYRFYGRCSGKYVRIYGSRVDGLGGADDIYGELQVESRSSDGGQLTIQGIPSKNYLCFNKKGKLVVKHSARNRMCLFDEIYSSDHYSEFESAANRTWAVGFGKRGQSLPGDRWTRSQRKARKCFQFLKMDSNDDGRGAGPGSGPRPGMVGPVTHRLQHGGPPRRRSSPKT